MENNVQNNNELHKTPPKFLENFCLDIRGEMQKKNITNSSPFKCMPSISTPPSQFFKIKNPFEAALNEKLHLHVFSPSVFQEAKRTSDKFRWTIDDLSSLRPAPIDVTTVHQFEQSNTEDDQTVQAKIEKYFNETHTVPSPWNEELKTEPLVNESSPKSTSKEYCDASSQTVLTLPPTLPPELEEALKPYFTFKQDQTQEDRNSSLCRRLFHFQEESEESLQESPIHNKLSPIGSPIGHSVQGRNFDSPRPPSPEISPISNSTPRRLTQCEFSPISSRLDIQMRSASGSVSRSMSPISIRLGKKCKSASRLDFSGHMSVDNSFNLAPENDLPDSYKTNSSVESPLRTNDFMENSCNWDMEYNNLSLSGKSIRKNLFTLYQRSNSESSMDISHQVTPRSNKSYSQRKKLSESFRLFDSDSEEEKEEKQPKQMRYHLQDDCKSNVKDVKDDIYLSQNTQDTGYNTCSELSQRTTCSRQEDDPMVTTDISGIENKENVTINIFASTPTKKYLNIY